MNNTIHIMLATTVSMIITFVLRCLLHQTRVDSSIIQQYMYDVNRDTMISIRCWLDGRHEFMICWRLLNSSRDEKLRAFVIYMSVIMLSLFLFGQRLWNLIRPMIQTSMIVWLLARFCEGKYVFYEPDIITMYFLIWQCTYIMCKWEDHDLSFPVLILQQGSFCISASLLSFLVHDYEHRFFPIQLNFAVLWLCSLHDVVSCLRIGGGLRKMSFSISYEYLPPGFYYPFDFEDTAIVTGDSDYDSVNKYGTPFDDVNVDYPCLGMGDFLAFSFMPLVVIDPLWSTTIKLYVFIGCIVSIQIGCYITTIVQHCWQVICMPGLPIPVITFSAYAIFIYHFVSNATKESTGSCP